MKWDQRFMEKKNLPSSALRFNLGRNSFKNSTNIFNHWQATGRPKQNRVLSWAGDDGSSCRACSVNPSTEGKDGSVIPRSARASESQRDSSLTSNNWIWKMKTATGEFSEAVWLREWRHISKRTGHPECLPKRNKEREKFYNKMC